MFDIEVGILLVFLVLYALLALEIRQFGDLIINILLM